MVKITCKICNKEGHHSISCKKFQNANADKRWELGKEHRLCFRCLRSRQLGHSCRPQKCSIQGCTGTHNRLLHYDKKEKSEIRNQKEEKETVANAWIPSKAHAYLKITPVRVFGPAGETSAYALLDDGSTVSLINEALAEEAGAEGRLEPLKMEAIGDIVIETPGSRRVTVAPANLQK